MLQQLTQTSSQARWAFRQGMWSLGVGTPRAFLAASLAYNLRDGIAEKITCPVFVGRAESDEFFRGQPEELMEHLTAPATLASFTDAEGAGAHRRRPAAAGPRPRGRHPSAPAASPLLVRTHHRACIASGPGPGVHNIARQRRQGPRTDLHAGQGVLPGRPGRAALPRLPATSPSPRRSTSSKTTPARCGAAPRKASWEPTNGGSRRALPAST